MAYTNETMAWAVHVANSQDILIYGAGTYSFFEFWNATCSGSNSCQTQIFDIQSGSGVYVYSLATVGVRYMLSVNEQGLIESLYNGDGYAPCISAWTPW